jgi:hypothetical protein
MSKSKSTASYKSFQIVISYNLPWTTFILSMSVKINTVRFISSISFTTCTLCWMKVFINTERWYLPRCVNNTRTTTLKQQQQQQHTHNREKQHIFYFTVPVWYSPSVFQAIILYEIYQVLKLGRKENQTKQRRKKMCACSFCI